MHALIIADLEGVTGLYPMHDSDQCKRLYTKEIEVFVKTLQKNGARKITVCDAHDKGDLIDRELLAKYDAAPVSQVWNMSFDEKYDFAILTGFHGMSGSRGYVPHTFRPDIKRAVSSGIELGEVEIFCRWLGGRQIPVILVSGDSEAVHEGNYFNAYRYTCCVKSRNMAATVSNKTIYNKIETTIEAALKLDFTKCVSKDNEPVIIEIVNNEIYDEINAVRCGNRGSLIYANCGELLANIKELADQLNCAISKSWETNIEFIKEIRDVIGDLPKEAVTNGHIKKLLTKSPAELTKKDRSEIQNYLRSLITAWDNAVTAEDTK